MHITPCHISHITDNHRLSQSQQQIQVTDIQEDKIRMSIKLIIR